MRKVLETEARWQEQYQAIESCNSIHEYQLASSGSKIGDEQFLLLRTLWRTYSPDKFIKDENGRVGQDYLERAREFLNSNVLIKDIWRLYLNATSDSSKTLIGQAYAGLGTFSLVKYHQLQSEGIEFKVAGIGMPKVDFSSPVSSRTRAQKILRETNLIPSTPTPTPAPIPTLAPTSYLYSTPATSGVEEGMMGLVVTEPPRTPSPPTLLTPEDHPSPFLDPPMLKDIEDEQIVNTALIDYLNALAIHCKDLEADWTLHRLGFIARNNEGKKSYEARVDGYLKSRNSGQPLVIVEVKPCSRKGNQNQIRMQESAQMAAWISHYPPQTSGITQ
ncbi:hypothetical protein F5Y03DRAFT_405770 [Xylaria venustula]|nr:hypothetical protein F5Y03DRAFT_405770 [Xylaria venustula]